MGQAKICVKCPTETEMYGIQAKAQAAGLVNHLVVRWVWVLLGLVGCRFFERATVPYFFPRYM